MSSSTATAQVVIPCFNEETRLDRAQLAELLQDPDVHLILVDDGSVDGTAAVLESFAADHPGRATALLLPRNGGKAEAVRAGMRHAVTSGASLTGYLDADFATPASEYLRLIGFARARPDAMAVLGSRVGLLGREILRSRARHYVGRAFATLASIALRLQVYDTQCGAKVFRVSPALDRATSTRFTTRWAFDVELLERLIREGRLDGVAPVFLEEPLQRWHDVAGSKVTLGGSARALFDLRRVAVRVRRSDRTSAAR